MVESEIYNSQTNLYPIGKDNVGQTLKLSDNTTETVSNIKEPVKRSNGRYVQSRKIKRTKSAGIF